MKIKDGFVLKNVAGETVVLPTGGVMDLDMMISLNDTARFLWEQMSCDLEEEDLVHALLKEYEVDEATARAAVQRFVNTLQENGFLD